MGNKLKIKSTFLNDTLYWTVYRLRSRKKFLWFAWDDWEYVALVKVNMWEDFLNKFEKYSGKAEVIRDDS